MKVLRLFLFQVVHSKYISNVTVALVGKMELALEWLVSTFTSETPSNSACEASEIKINHSATKKTYREFNKNTNLARQVFVSKLE